MTRKTWIRIGIVIVITYVMCFSDCSFAASGGTGHLGDIAWVLDFIISVLCRIWVIFANLAGEFLTNNWVYGQALGLDALLWQYRNIVKNMANFCLGFYLVYVIFNGLIGQYRGKENVVKNLGKVLKWVLVAGIGVQASWFVTSVVVDLSTVTLSAVGALPFQVLSKNDNLEESINKSMSEFFDDGGSIAYGKIHNLFPEGSVTNSFIETKDSPTVGTISKDNLMDSLLPNKDDISGPLYYMGFAILRTQELNSVKSYGVKETTEKEVEVGAKQTILNLIIQGGTTIVYSIEMGIFCVIALMRILYLWMFIVLSPFAILLACIKKAGGDDILKRGFISDLMKQINLKTFLAKVFQPVIIVLGISLSMIFVTLISGVVNKDSTRSMENVDMGGANINALKEGGDTTNNDKTYTTTIEGNMVKFSMSGAGKGILDFIMSIITVILVYFIIKISIEAGDAVFGVSGEDFLSKRIKKVTEGVDGLVKSVPIVPVAGYDKDGVRKTHYMSFDKVSHLGQAGIAKLEGMVKDRYKEQNAIIDNLLNKGGIKYKAFKYENQQKIQNAVDGNPAITGLAILGTQFTEIRKFVDDPNTGLKKGEGYGMVLNPVASDRWWQGRFEKWLTNVDQQHIRTSEPDGQTWLEMVKWRQDPNNKDKTLEKLFSKSKYVEAYARKFDLGNNVHTWEELKNKDISEGKL